MASFSTTTPGVILYSYHIREPVDLSDYIESVRVETSLAASTNDTATIVLEKAWLGELPVLGDWVQIDLLQSAYDYSEHIFFGYIVSIDQSATTMGFGGASSRATIVCKDFSYILNKNDNIGKLWGQYHVPDLSAGSGKTESLTPLSEKFPPSLIGVVSSLSKTSGHSFKFTSAAFPTCTLLVEMFLEVFLLWGGEMFNTFFLPASFGGGTSYPLYQFICKRNQRRLDPFDTRIRFRDWWSELYNPNPSGPIPVLTFAQSKLLEGLDQAETGEEWKKSGKAMQAYRENAWRRAVDWDEMFDGLDYFFTWRTADFLDLANKQMVGSEGSVWKNAMQWSDIGWTELFSTLVEHVEWPRESLKDQTVTCSNGRVYRRDFLPCISLRPVPHPVFFPDENTLNSENVKARSRNTEPVMAEWGPVIEADSFAYENYCTKFVIDLNAINQLSAQRTTSGVHNWYSTLVRGAVGLKKVVSQFGGITEGPALRTFTKGRMPLMVESMKERYGHQPLEMMTNYAWVLPNGKAESDQDPTSATPLLWEALCLKNYLQYCWNIKNVEYVSGGMEFPLFDINVPRPGDVGYIMGEPETSSPIDPTSGSSIFDSLGVSGVGYSVPIKTHSGMATNFSSPAHALSVYVEGVSISLEKGDGFYAGTIGCSFSKGQWVTLPSKSQQWANISEIISREKVARPTVNATQDREVYFRYVNPDDLNGFYPIYWLPYRGKDVHVGMAKSISEIKKQKPLKYADDPASEYWTVLTSQEIVNTRKKKAKSSQGQPSHSRSSTPIVTPSKTWDIGSVAGAAASWIGTITGLKESVEVLKNAFPGLDDSVAMPARPAKGASDQEKAEWEEAYDKAELEAENDDGLFSKIKETLNDFGL